MEMTTMTKVKSERIRAHEANLDRYCHLLLTELTSEERRYLHMRIKEEQDKLTRLQAGDLGTTIGTITAAPAMKVPIDGGGYSSH